jgi:deazaflavin-dependent oxidoreductase (nitroreductase family)
MSASSPMDLVWPVLNRALKAHTAVYRATNGAIGHRIPFYGAPMLLLDHTGAKSGAKRTTPLIYVEDGDDVFIVASKGGHPRHPAWYHNLRKNPDTTIQIGPHRRAVRARVATDEEHERLWPKAVETYGSFASYQRRAERKIPIVILEPRTGR